MGSYRPWPGGVWSSATRTSKSAVAARGQTEVPIDEANRGELRCVLPGWVGLTLGHELRICLSPAAHLPPRTRGHVRLPRSVTHRIELDELATQSPPGHLLDLVELPL